MLEKISVAEAALKEKDEINKSLAQILEETDKQRLEAERQAEEANEYAEMLVKEAFASKSSENVVESNNRKKQDVELNAQLVEKESQLEIVSEEMVSIQQLFDEAQAKIQQQNRELLLLFNHSESLKSSLKEAETLKHQIDLREKELDLIKRQAQIDKYDMVNFIRSLESKIKADEL